jgi:PIN domain nuclease of toxin-antitoxin system
LDTHALLWWRAGDSALSPPARRLIADMDNEIFVSAVSIWEISIKTNRGNLENGLIVLETLPGFMKEQRLEFLPIVYGHAVRAGMLPDKHEDPFDRMLVAQAQAENLAIISADKIFDCYGIRRIW